MHGVDVRAEWAVKKSKKRPSTKPIASSASAAPREDDDRGRHVDLAVLALGTIVMWVVPHRVGGDAEVRYEALARLFTTGKLSAPRYSVVAPLFAAPLHALGRLTGDPRGVTALFNVVLFTIALVLLWRELDGQLPRAPRRAVVLLLLFASMFARHVQSFYGEVFTALTVTLGVFWLARGKYIPAWLAIVVGGVNTPASVVGIGAIAVRTWRRTRDPRHLAAPVLVLALALLENRLMRGSALDSGYSGDAGFKTVMPYSGQTGFSYPFFLGLLAILFSFGKGLVWFTPGLFAPLARSAGDRLRWVHGTLLWFVAGLVLVYAKWWAWYGGFSWGPRYFVFASIPASLLVALLLHRPPEALLAKCLLLAVLALSAWVGTSGAVFGLGALDVCTRDDFALEALCWYVPEFSVLWNPLVHFPELTARTAAVVAYCAAVFAYLAAPLARDVAVRLAQHARAAGSAGAWAREWRL